MKEFTMMQKTGLQIYHFFRGWVNLKFAQAYCMAYCNIYTWYSFSVLPKSSFKGLITYIYL